MATIWIYCGVDKEKVIIEIVDLPERAAKRRWYKRPRYLGDGQPLAAHYTCYPLILPSAERRAYRRALGEALAMAPAYWAASQREPPSGFMSSTVCRGRELLFTLALCEFRAADQVSGRRILLYDPPAFLIEESIKLLLAKGAEVLLYLRETNVGEDIAFRLYHEIGLPVQAVFRPPQVDADLAVAFDEQPPPVLQCPLWQPLARAPRLYLRDKPLSAAVLEAMLLGESFDLAEGFSLAGCFPHRLAAQLRKWQVRVVTAEREQSLLDFF